MQSELITELFSVVLYVVVAGALTVGGVVAEYTSLQYLGSGESTVALWLAGVGLVMLYAGVYGVGYGKILSRLV